MSSYRYETENEGLDIKPSCDPRNTFIWVHEGKKEAAISIPNADIPAVAAELLKAAGQESVIVAKATMQVEVFSGGYLRCGMTDAAKNATAGWARGRASELLAIAEYIEGIAVREAAEKAEAEAAEKKLQERRDGLAAELSEGRRTYGSTGLTAQAAIDRIIELEDGK